MQPWTHDDRSSFIKRAVESTDTRGSKSNYWFNVMPKTTGLIDADDEKRAKATDALAKAIYNSGKYRSMSMKIYDLLQQKIISHPNLIPRDHSNIAVVVKGSNAYAMLFPNATDTFSNSDLDIVIMINPNIPKVEFDRIKMILHTIVVQTISQYKRCLDHMLFLNKPFPDIFMSPQDIAGFKEALDNALTEADPRFLSPFSSDVVRNACSRNSFIIADSVGHEDSVVRVEVPHFEKCECIPLRKTPLFCSYNETLDFNRARSDQKDVQDLKAKFNLYRMKMVMMFLNEDKEEKVTADFIDISISSQIDSELIDFWSHGRCLTIFDPSINNWVWVPDMHTCMRDLYKMLNVYECPESKREKRQKKLDIMCQIASQAAMMA